VTRPDAAARLRRLLAVIPWIADHQGAHLEDIAARFGISAADLQRDLELVPFCGLPPYTPDRLIDLSIVDGVVHLRFAEYFSRPLQLTSDEGFALLAAGRALLAVPGADPQGSLAGALAKLETVLGGAGGMKVEIAAPPFVEALRKAAEAGERVEIDYYSFSSDTTSRRRIDPRSVFLAGGQWYVDAWCHLATDDRLFRVDRVRALQPTGEHFEPAPGEPERSVFRPRPDDLRVTLLLRPEARWVVETYPTEAVTEEPEGHQRVVMAASGRAWLERLLISLGPAAEIAGPPEAVEIGRAAAARLLARYRT
jgi:proteasome accessory factor C